MTQKICLVTGANSGIGKEISLALAAAGEHVIMVCRNQEKAKLALIDIQHITGSKSVDLVIADLSSQHSIRELADTLYKRYSRLDVLINNAGVVSTHKVISSDGIEMTLATNYLSSFLLTNLLIDLLKKSAPSRIVNVSSAVHKWGKLDLQDLQFDRRKYQFMKAYAQSKLLMQISTFELARRLEGSGVTVNCVHPGAVRTSLGSDSANNVILKWVDKLIKFFFISSKEAALTPAYLALSPEVANITGKYFAKMKVAASSATSMDPILARKVWDISEKLTDKYHD